MPESGAELRAWLAGHEIANRRQRDRVASMTAEEKLHQLSRLMSSTGLFEMSRRNSGDQFVIDLWQQLRARSSNRE